MSTNLPSSPALRASDADRDRVIELLRAAAADGRLDPVEVELVLAPGMVVDANALAVRHSILAISKDAGDSTPETLYVHLVGRMRHGRTDTRWPAPHR
jgi:uncharacterized protein DUF1707